MQNQMGGRMPQHMMQGQMMGQHMMVQSPHGNMGPGPQQMMPSGVMQPGQQLQQHLVHPSQQQAHPSAPQVQEQPKLDSISRAKALLPTIKEIISNVFKTCAEATYANHLIDSSTKAAEYDVNNFYKAFEEFYSVCDHMEMHLKSSIECMTQGTLSQQNLSTNVSHTKLEGTLSHPQFIGVVGSQIAYAKEVHDALAEATHKILE